MAVPSCSPIVMKVGSRCAAYEHNGPVSTVHKLGEVIDLSTVKNAATEAEGVELAKIRLLQKVDDVRLGVMVLEGETKEQTNDSNDVFYLVQEGSIDIHIKDESVSLAKGEGYVVMKKSPYRITASAKAVVMVLQAGKEG